MIKTAVRNILRKDAAERVIKARPQESLEVLKLKLEALLKGASDKALKAFYERVLETLRATGDTAQALESIGAYLEALPETVKAGILAETYAVTRDLWKAGFLLVSAENKGMGMAFNLSDLDAINIIGRNNLYWIGEHFTEEVKAKLNGLLTEMFDRGMTVQELGKGLAEEMKPIIAEEQVYWEGLADHIAVKTKELGRVAGYERAGIRYVKVQAILDERTSQICRSMHGRIISVERLGKQAEAIMAAGTKEELKAAQSWLPAFGGRTGDLPEGVAGPPYHYRCRTTTVAYFEELDGAPAGEETYQFFDGRETRKEKVLFRHYDRELGRELVLTEGAVGHSKLLKDKLIAAMRSIERFGESNEHKGQLASLSQNGVFLAFRDNVVWTGFSADKDYFKRKTSGGMRKWAELLKRFFTATRSLQ